LPPGTVCYLCGQVIGPSDDWNRDHVPPSRIFATEVRRQHNPNLAWLYSHGRCNSAYRADEEYFVASFVGHVRTPTANAVFAELGEAARRGHGVGLLREVISRFGTIVGPRGEVLYSFDSARVNRFLWKLVRGLYHLELGAVLPENLQAPIHLISPATPVADLENLGWFPAVRDTEPLARYGGVFDYKWLGWKDDELRGHAFAMLFWDGLIAATLFHDPRCRCGSCPASRASRADA
jgi:hypothetical protein